MKIYILEQGEYEECFATGIFSSTEKAFDYITKERETRQQSCSTLREETLDCPELTSPHVEIPDSCFQPEPPPPQMEVVRFVFQGATARLIY